MLQDDIKRPLKKYWYKAINASVISEYMPNRNKDFFWYWNGLSFDQMGRRMKLKFNKEIKDLECRKSKLRKSEAKKMLQSGS